MTWKCGSKKTSPIQYARNAKLFSTVLGAKKRGNHSLGKEAYFDSLGPIYQTGSD